MVFFYYDYELQVTTGPPFGVYLCVEHHVA